VTTTDYEAVDFLLKQEGRIDLVIPRGGEKLIRRVVAKSRIPVVKHYQGICHVYVDKKADLKKAVAITLNAKLQRPGVCNAMETLLVDHGIAERVLPPLFEIYLSKGVELRTCQATRAALQSFSWADKLLPASEDDWRTEYLAPILSVRLVHGLDQAIDHIAKYGSAHTDSIITENHTIAMRFLREVDSASVMVNASTRFADGFEFGLGAEIGISTNKLHARGPVGLEGLTTQKWVVLGNGHIRS
jgi:glutamate-5-semialdehyde dehydrogenase